jgi:NLI interacting factor-like phosphatase
VSIRVLALDLERTLISDALRADPRPGLFDFLAFCNRRFERVTLFTCVEEADAREILDALAHAGHVPQDFLERLEYVEWAGEHKDLNLVPDAVPNEVLLVDDEPGWIRPDQRGRWIAIAPWDRGQDGELLRLQAALECWPA